MRKMRGVRVLLQNAKGIVVDQIGRVWLTCPACLTEKPLDQFGLRRMKPHPKAEIRNQSYCKECR